ncbi:MAG: hypothetical protein ACFB02_08410 [Mastigocoleus sp.]
MDVASKAHHMKKNKVIIKPEDLITILEARKKLGVGYSRSTIMRRIADGDWIEGVHYIDDAPRNARYRSIRLSLPAIQEWRSMPSAKR